MRRHDKLKKKERTDTSLQ